MAERRMFAKTIIDSDAFLDMPLSAQALYFHLSMRADDDGFINNPKRIQRMIGASDDDYKLLIAKSFVILFESGVIVIKHWRINNYIRGDRKHDTVYQEEYDLLAVKDNGAYTIEKTELQPLDRQLVGNRYTEVSIGKDSIDKVSIDNNIVEIVDYLNLVCQSKYNPKTKNTIKHINARLSEGYTIEDFKTVIDKKYDEWKGTQMEQYLRPDTLFGTKFESYLNQKINKEKGRTQSSFFDALRDC